MPSKGPDPGVASAEYREVSEGRLTNNRRVYPLAPFLDGAALRRYVHYKRRYPHILALEEERDGETELPRRFELTQYCQNLVAAHGSPVAADAVRNGNIGLLNWLTGLTERDVDASAVQRFSELQHHLRRAGYLAVFAGSTDGGKTNTALVMSEIHLRDNPDAVLATNVRSLAEEDGWSSADLNDRTVLVESRSELREAAEQYDDVIAVLDEMSTQANAQTSNYDVNEHFYELVTFKSKLNLRMIVIGHRESGLDIAPAIREHSTHFVKQVREEHDLDDDEYRAEFYEAIADGYPVGKQFVVSPVPEASADYDPDEQATFALVD